MAGTRLPRTGLAAFATGSFGMGIWITVPGLLLLYFLTDVLAVPPLLAGTALLVPKIADVVLHPWVGSVSDAGLARHGSRRRLLLVGCALVLAFVTLFAVPGGLTGPAAAAWVAVAFVAGNLLFAAYQVPYLSTPADLAIGYHERTRLMGFRMVVLTVGILASGLAAPLLAGRDEPTRGGYATMSIALGVLMLAAMLVGVAGVGRLAAAAPPNPGIPPTVAELPAEVLSAAGASPAADELPAEVPSATGVSRAAEVSPAAEAARSAEEPAAEAAAEAARSAEEPAAEAAAEAARSAEEPAAEAARSAEEPAAEAAAEAARSAEEPAAEAARSAEEPAAEAAAEAARSAEEPARPEHRLRARGLLVALRDRQFRWLIGSYLAMSTTSHLVLAAVPYYTEYELGRPKLTTVLVAAFLAPALLATPGWVALARRYGKQRGLLLAQAVFVLGCLVLAAGNAVGVPVLVGAVALLGIAFAALQLLPFSMLPDVVAASGRPESAGSYTGVWTATDSLGGALGPYVYAACLALGGFMAGGDPADQPGSAGTWIRLGFGAVPAALMLLALVIQRRYRLDGTAQAAQAAQTAQTG
ncbi:MFS transporter [Dactylosporangium sp. CS-033363]|uniref:MFS transporter n=1 Tax=Dactylosporangium sp. CS-033363 TaxID=3239935 RepID=UPI003D9417FF